MFTNESDQEVSLWFQGGGPVARLQPNESKLVLPPTSVGAQHWKATCSLPLFGDDGYVLTLGMWTHEASNASLVESSRTTLRVAPGTHLKVPPLPAEVSKLKPVLVWQRGLRKRMRARAEQRAKERFARRKAAATTIQRLARGLIARISRQCEICLEDCPLPMLVKLASCRTHGICTHCAELYVDSQLHEGRLFVRCPGAGCQVLLTTATLTKFASGGAIQKYREHLEARHTNRLLTEDDECFLAFCREGARRCPACGVIIWRCSGCDHMRCVCGQQFNWQAAEAMIVLHTQPANALVAAGA
jgi:hypothetical protein